MIHQNTSPDLQQMGGLPSGSGEGAWVPVSVVLSCKMRTSSLPLPSVCGGEPWGSLPGLLSNVDPEEGSWYNWCGGGGLSGL